MDWIWTRYGQKWWNHIRLFFSYNPITAGYQRQCIYNSVRSCLVKGDAENCQVLGRMSLYTPVRFQHEKPNMPAEQQCCLKKVQSFEYDSTAPVLFRRQTEHALMCSDEGCFFHITSSVTFKTKHSHANTPSHAVKSNLSNTITDLTNSTEGKKWNTISLLEGYRAPPETSTPSIIHCWFYKASTIRDLIWLYYNNHWRDGAINQIVERKERATTQENKEMNWKDCSSFSVLLLSEKESDPASIMPQMKHRWHQKAMLPYLSRYTGAIGYTEAPGNKGTYRQIHSHYG